MKKTLSNILFAALVVLAAASCQKDLNLDTENEAGASRVLVASFAADTKTTLGDNNTPKWAENDVVKLINGSNTKDFTLKSTISDATSEASIIEDGAKFEVTLPDGWTGTIYACYPASAYSSISGDAVAINLPSETDGSFGKANICTAKCTGGSTLSFENATAILKITTAESDATKDIKIAISGGTPAEITLTPSASGDQYVAVPAGKQFKDITFTVTKNDGSWATKTSTSTSNTEINNIYDLQSISSEWSLTYNPAGSLPGVFSVSSSTKVRFSKGNLRVKKDGDNWTWGFYENQYDCNTASSAASTDTEIDRFTWGYGTNSTNPTTTSYESTFTDWGTVMGGSVWSTLSKDEWKYLLSGGADGRGSGVRYFKFPVSVAGKANCLVIAPDGNTTAIEESYDASAWETAEASGLICLPPAGYRYGSPVEYVGEFGYYWSATSIEEEGFEEFAWRMYFGGNTFFPTHLYFRNYGHSVRLVCTVSD